MRPRPKDDDLDPATGRPAYETYEDYIIGLTRWTNECHDIEKAHAAKQDEFRQWATQATETLQSRITAFVKDHPDYNDVIGDPSLQISPAQAEYLYDPENEDGPAMAYALGKDPAICAAIRAMPDRQATMAMGRLHATVRAASLSATPPRVPPPKAVPTPLAPPPPTPVRGAATPSTLSLEQMAKSGDIAAFFAARNAEEQRQRMMR
jgi:hypothetical protein